MVLVSLSHATTGQLTSNSRINFKQGSCRAIVRRHVIRGASRIRANSLPRPPLHRTHESPSRLTRIELGSIDERRNKRSRRAMRSSSLYCYCSFVMMPTERRGRGHELSCRGLYVCRRRRVNRGAVGKGGFDESASESGVRTRKRGQNAITPNISEICVPTPVNPPPPSASTARRVPADVSAARVRSG